MLIPRKYHIHLVALIAVATIIFYPVLSKRIEPQTLADGTASAEYFLALVDAGEYEQSWEDSAALMKEKIFLEVWMQQVPAMRNKVGHLNNRSLEDSSISDWAAGGTEGQYLTLKYASNFENKSSVIETINLTLEEDHIWRVAGYFMK